MNFREFLEWNKPAKQIYYHGTPAVNIPKILNQGLIAFPKNKAWSVDVNEPSIYHPSRASIGGVYVSQNLMTALSAVSNGANRQHGHERGCLVILEMQPRTLIGDEDSYAMAVENIPNTGNEYQIANLYKITRKIHDHLPVSEEEINYYENTVRDWVKGFLRMKYMSDSDPRLLSALEKLLKENFFYIIQRKAAALVHPRKPDDTYYHDRYFKYSDLQNNHPYYISPDKLAPPPVASAEVPYREFMNKLTKVLKQQTWDMAGDFMKVARIEQDIGFNGTNRILNVVEFRRNEKEMAIWYPHNGEISSKAAGDFWKQWEERIGSRPKIVKAQ